jgi:mono/diheme cytochrome c family protein
MNKTLISFILFVAGLAVFHNVVFPVFKPDEFSWVFNRYVYFLLICAFMIIANIAMKLKPPISLNALVVWCLGFYFYDHILYPHVPWTLFITYMMLWSIGCFLYISQDADTFAEFRRPIVKVIIGEYKIARIVAFTALPFLVGWGTYNSIYPKFEEPVELRTVHPAPPATTKVHGKTYTLETARNPFRVDEQDNYKNSFPFLDADKNEYMKNVTEGGTIFFQNCHYCHGDQLNGLGMFSHVFNPTPANFIDPGTIAMLRESFLFWRVSKGGPGLPNESTPWSSAMPPWEEHLNTEEIWKVILFEYWYTGWHPRTFDTEESYVGQWEKEGKPAGVH